MLNEPTLEKLRALRLTTLAAAWNEQQKNTDMVPPGSPWVAEWVDEGNRTTDTWPPATYPASVEGCVTPNSTATFLALRLPGASLESNSA
jgi:hypothetical protein